MRVPVPDADPVRLHPAVGRIPEVAGHGQRAVPEHLLHRRRVASADGVRLRRHGQQHGGLGEGVLRLGQPDVVQRLGGRHRHLERPRVRVAHVLGRGDDQPPGDEPRVLAGRDHRAQPVQRGVGIVAAEALDERRHGVVVAVAGPVVGEDALLGGGLDVVQGGGDAAVGVPGVVVLGQGRGALEDVEDLPCIAAGDVHEVLERVVGEGDAATGPERPGQPPFGVRDGAPDDHGDVLVGERLQAPDAHPRQEGGVDLEVRVLRRCPDEGHRPVLDVREQGVLLRLVEAVDLVDEQDAAAAIQRQALLGARDRGPHLGDAGHDGREGVEVGADRVREEPGERGLAGARRAPQEQRREVTAGDGPAERAALADELLLADELVQVARAHPRGEGLALRRRPEQGFGTGTGDGAPRGHGRDGSAGPATAGRVPAGRDQPIGMIFSLSMTIQRPNRTVNRSAMTRTMSFTSRAT